jgi:hypothetical protein
MDDLFKRTGIFDPEAPEGVELAPGYIRVPAVVSHRDGRLRYRWEDDDLPRDDSAWETPWQDRAARQRLGLPFLMYPSPQLLSRFLRLAEESDDEIAGFARKWGPLYLCKHGLPANHEPGSTRLVPSTSTCAEMDHEYEAGSEPIEGWRVLSRIANAMVRLAQEVRAGKVGSREDWQVVLQEGHVWAFKVFLPPGEPDRLSLLAGAINAWVAVAQYRPAVRVVNNTPVIRFGTDSRKTALLGALGFQLMLRLTGPLKQVLCTVCGEPYVPKRRPAASKAHYCKKCERGGEPVRRAKEGLRNRKLKALSLAASGESPEQIASSTGSRLKTVKGWLRRVKKRSRLRRAGPGN